MLQSGYCFTFSNNRFCYPIFKFWYEDHCFNEILLLLLFLLIRDHICIKLILTCGVYICSLNLWNYPFFLFYVLNVNFPRPLISSIVFCKLVLKNIEVLFSSMYSITFAFWIFNNCYLYQLPVVTLYDQSQLRSISLVILSNYIHCLNILGMRLLFGKQCISGHWF